MVRIQREAGRLGGHYFLIVTHYNRNFGGVKFDMGQRTIGSSPQVFIPMVTTTV